MKKYFTNEVKIAVVAIVALVALFFGMNFLKGLNMFSQNSTYKIAFSDLKGLSKTTPVYADGYKVGTVADILYDYEKHGNITVMIDVDPKLRIPVGTTACVERDLMGNMNVTLLFANNPRERVEEGGTIQGVDTSGMMSSLQQMMPAVQQMLPKLDSILTNINAILSDPALRNIVHNADATMANVKVSSAELQTLMRTLNANVPGLLDKADKTMANTETLTGNLAALDLQGTMAKVNNTLDNVQQLTDALNSKQGTLGLLMHDPGLYNNLNSTMMHADSLMIDLKAHPKRYVHFSVFGKKDK